MRNLVEVFAQLEADQSSLTGRRVISAVPFPGNADRHLGKSHDGLPTILVKAPRAAGECLPVSYMLEHLRIAHDCTCRIKLADQSEYEDRFSVVECRSSDPTLHSLFLRTMEALLADVPMSASLTEFADSLNRLVLLFQAIQRAPMRPVIGLWGELWLISTSRDPIAAIRAWHESPMETTDFSSGTQRIEVKCSSDRTRRHHFTLDQAHAPNEIAMVIASVLVDQATSGVSLGHLWDELRRIAAHEPSLLLKIDRLCIESLGAAWEDARHKSFDAERAAQSLLIFDSREIPRIQLPVPAGVSEVHFRADLSASTPIALPELITAGGLFADVFDDRRRVG